MPGPSFSWSAFANSRQSALDVIASDRMVTVVVERLDESLVVAAHFLGEQCVLQQVMNMSI